MSSAYPGDSEFLDGEVELVAVAAGGAAHRVEFDAHRAQGAGPGGGATAGQGADAQNEFGKVEGLGEVVVGAQGQAADAVAR
ncbi:hypothetical protein [Streptomyces sp. NPDC051286]|uniref:hypothetical protein n=1 Tax=Streptomyces sp. NPDC051286 TaxID=3365647 RepID=UPI00378CD858